MTNERPEAPVAVQRFDRGAVAVATITLALTTWPIVFNLGAYGEVFYEDVFSFVVAATVALVIAVLASPYEGQHRWFTICVLAAPGAWLALAVILFDSTAAAASDGFFGLIGLLIVILSIPTVLKLLMDLFVPDLTSLRDSRQLGAAIAVLVLVAVAGYVAGANNDAFLTCRDFEVAGADKPENCAPHVDDEQSLSFDEGAA